MEVLYIFLVPYFYNVCFLVLSWIKIIISILRIWSVIKKRLRTVFSLKISVACPRLTPLLHLPQTVPVNVMFPSAYYRSLRYMQYSFMNDRSKCLFVYTVHVHGCSLLCVLKLIPGLKFLLWVFQSCLLLIWFWIDLMRSLTLAANPLSHVSGSKPYKALSQCACEK